MRRSNVTRFVWRITALLQLVLPPFVLAADAQLERKGLSARAQSHVESDTGKNCAPVHTPDCALCQHIASSLAKPAKAALPVLAVRPNAPLRERCAVAATATDQRQSLPRAPPIA